MKRAAPSALLCAIVAVLVLSALVAARAALGALDDAAFSNGGAAAAGAGAALALLVLAWPARALALGRNGPTSPPVPPVEPSRETGGGEAGSTGITRTGTGKGGKNA